MKTLSLASTIVATLAVIIAGASLGLTLLGLAVRHFRWSDSMLGFFLLAGAVSVFLITCCFRNQATASKTTLTFVMLFLNLALFVVFRRNPLEF